MGLFNKLKNVLFEEEEVEIPVEEPEKKETFQEEKKHLERKKNVYDEIVRDEDPLVTDRSIFKAEKTFDFPMFDDQEFEEMKNATFPKEENESMSINLFDYEKPKIKKEIKKQPEIKGRAYESKSEGFDTRKFKPSPVISPVYGVLDKNYKKEDIVVKTEVPKKAIDVDVVRKKAFGTLEDDIERTLSSSRNEKKVTPPEKTIDELLEESSFDTIDLPEIKEDKSVRSSVEELDVLDKPVLKKKEEQLEQNDTLENDLFDLIDSMYENREDE